MLYTIPSKIFSFHMTKVKKTFDDRTKFSPFNKFMKTEFPKVKADNPEISNQEAFKIVSRRWRESPENPKN
ncbi:hypothetical protein C1645_771215 [Glomus cerebriforme]|uniref:HMG box domain-containing protein n=1 Tax=Glomus cerebriforme TaxID=658196 RepID=A0A397T457_9GLOM|nr:hypothetical protein C1645_771215 [Glomus cerebriforme]